MRELSTMVQQYIGEYVEGCRNKLLKAEESSDRFLRILLHLLASHVTKTSCSLCLSLAYLIGSILFYCLLGGIFHDFSLASEKRVSCKWDRCALTLGVRDGPTQQ